MIQLPFKLSLARPTWPVSAAPHRRQRVGRGAVISFVLATVCVNVGLVVCMERLYPTLRDPEYGRRLTRLQAQRRANPDRPFAVVLGSSRTAMGVRPREANADAGPLTFNMGQIGAGPVIQLMTLRRLLAAGVTPEAVAIEYWPAFLREDGPYAEEARTDKRRLIPQDEPFIRDYFEQREHTLATMRQLRWNPVFEYRGRLLNQIDHRWLHLTRRFENSFENLDDWGWLPGQPKDFDPPVKARIHASVWAYYGQLFQNYHVGPIAKRAMHEMIALCRERGIRVAFVWLPESRMFLVGYPPAVVQEVDQYLATVRAEFDLPLIDGRAWVEDDQIFDGFHLSQAGAATFSVRLGEAIRATFPDLVRRNP